jgi:hypothetical protein
MENLTDCALVPLPPEGGAEIALPEVLVERAKDYMAESLTATLRFNSDSASA